MQIYIV